MYARGHSHHSHSHGNKKVGLWIFRPKIRQNNLRPQAEGMLSVHGISPISKGARQVRYVVAQGWMDYKELSVYVTCKS